jgi:prephenate dehydrogenase
MLGTDGGRLRLGIVGTGHIGASLAFRLSHKAEVYVTDSNTETLKLIGSAPGIQAVEELRELAFLCETIVVATPTPSVAAILNELDATERPLYVYDVSSAKIAIQEARRQLSNIHHVSLHPMAGREGVGVLSADATIFDKAAWGICLEGSESDSAVARGLEIALSAGASYVVPLDYDTHDRVIALSSHLPHATAFALASTLLHSQYSQQGSYMVAGSFRDGVRVALSDPERVMEMFWPTRAHLITEIDAMISELIDLKRAITSGNGLSRIAAIRNALGELLRPEFERKDIVLERKLATELLGIGSKGGVILSIGILDGSWAISVGYPDLHAPMQ